MAVRSTYTTSAQNFTYLTNMLTQQRIQNKSLKYGTDSKCTIAQQNKTGVSYIKNYIYKELNNEVLFKSPN